MSRPELTGSPFETPGRGCIDRAIAGLEQHANALRVEERDEAEMTAALKEKERIATLERELRKHQQANVAFQKALREIGEIVTAVARGDLSKRVLMNTGDMDPDITTFKRTINTMMDQLQVFSNEVSRVAREVGTEGMLGGQARIEGVAGTWKELTDNGMPSPSVLTSLPLTLEYVLTLTQSTSWPRISQTKCVRSHP